MVPAAALPRGHLPVGVGPLRVGLRRAVAIDELAPRVADLHSRAEHERHRDEARGPTRGAERASEQAEGGHAEGCGGDRDQPFGRLLVRFDAALRHDVLDALLLALAGLQREPRRADERSLEQDHRDPDPRRDPPGPDRDRCEQRQQRGERDAWRERAETLLRGLGEAIDAQLREWQLTPPERDTALLLLKGYGHKEIASLAGRSERTVRQHAVAVYRKSGLGGRAELAAFFLEDLLLPPEPAPPSR